MNRVHFLTKIWRKKCNLAQFLRIRRNIALKSQKIFTFNAIKIPDSFKNNSLNFKSCVFYSVQFYGSLHFIISDLLLHSQSENFP
jgi:hypothetical protein